MQRHHRPGAGCPPTSRSFPLSPFSAKPGACLPETTPNLKLLCFTLLHFISLCFALFHSLAPPSSAPFWSLGLGLLWCLVIGNWTFRCSAHFNPCQRDNPINTA